MGTFLTGVAEGISEYAKEKRKSMQESRSEAEKRRYEEAKERAKAIEQMRLKEYEAGVQREIAKQKEAGDTQRTYGTHGITQGYFEPVIGPDQGISLRSIDAPPSFEPPAGLAPTRIELGKGNRPVSTVYSESPATADERAAELAMRKDLADREAGTEKDVVAQGYGKYVQGPDGNWMVAPDEGIPFPPVMSGGVSPEAASPEAIQAPGQDWFQGAAQPTSAVTGPVARQAVGQVTGPPVGPSQSASSQYYEPVANESYRVVPDKLNRAGTRVLSTKLEGGPKEKKALTADQTNALIGTEDAIASLEKMMSMYDKMKDRTETGPFSARYWTPGGFFGKMGNLAMNIRGTPEEAAFKQLSLRFLNAYIKAQTGAQRGMKEVDWLSSAVPNPGNDREDMFINNMNVALKELKENRRRIGAFLDTAGYSVPVPVERGERDASARKLSPEEQELINFLNGGA